MGFLKFRVQQFDGNPVAVWHSTARDLALSGPAGGFSTPPQLGEEAGLVSEPRQGEAWPSQQPPFSHRFNFRVGWSWSSSNVWFLLPFVLDTFGLEAPSWPAFSEEGSWRRGLSAASVSAAGGAAPAPTGRAASWSWTRWTEGIGQGFGEWTIEQSTVRPADLRITRVGF